MDEKLIRLLRVQSAKDGKSMSKYVAGLVKNALAENLAESEEGPEADNPQLAAVKKILAMPKWDLTIDGRMPTSQERNSRD